jgi:hypothetical protein
MPLPFLPDAMTQVAIQTPGPDGDVLSNLTLINVYSTLCNESFVIFQCRSTSSMGQETYVCKYIIITSVIHRTATAAVSHLYRYQPLSLSATVAVSHIIFRRPLLSATTACQPEDFQPSIVEKLLEEDTNWKMHSFYDIRMKCCILLWDKNGTRVWDLHYVVVWFMHWDDWHNRM